MASFLGLGLFDPDAADEPTSAGMFSDNLDDYTFDSIETRKATSPSSLSAAATPIPIREVSKTHLNHAHKGQYHFLSYSWLLDAFGSILSYHLFL